MRILFISFIIIFSQNINGQIGLSARFGDLSPSLWEDKSNQNMFNSNYEIGIDYWLRLKNYRLEFTPEVYFSKAQTATTENINYDYQAFGLAANTNIYIFDFEGDCDCPTFSKQGNYFTKGFFLSVSPIISYQTTTIKAPDESSNSNSRAQFEAAIGAGFDIGILDLLTITPFVRYKIQPFQKWDGFNTLHGSSDPDENFLNSYLQFGLRFGFRPDYVGQQRRFRR